MESPRLQPVDPSVQAGLVQLTRGDFPGAQKAWEESWRSSRGAERELFQALAQLAAAFQQWSLEKSSEAATLLGRARGQLGALPSALLGVDISELELQLGTWQEAAERGEAAPLAPGLVAGEPPGKPRRLGHRARCPYCGEWVEVQADALGVPEESYVEDCPVCCRPWTVHVSREGSRVAVRLGHEDD